MKIHSVLLSQRFSSIELRGVNPTNQEITLQGDRGLSAQWYTHTNTHILCDVGLCTRVDSE